MHHFYHFVLIKPNCFLFNSPAGLQLYLVLSSVVKIILLSTSLVIFCRKRKAMKSKGKKNRNSLWETTSVLKLSCTPQGSSSFSSSEFYSSRASVCKNKDSATNLFQSYLKTLKYVPHSAASFLENKMSRHALVINQLRFSRTLHLKSLNLWSKCFSDSAVGTENDGVNQACLNIYETPPEFL